MRLKITLLFLFTLFYSYSQVGPKREMRSSWLTTIWGLDWPSNKINTTGSTYYINLQKNQLINILDKLQEANINAVFFQVRSECDAMYQSSYEPWSYYLVTTRGMEPGYDPLQFAIEEAHKRGMELHVWLNPYRFESSVGKYEGEAGDYRVTHPEWVLEYPDKSDGSKNVSILDPGNPGVRQLISDVVEEIITNYDVDGVVFDDYFYAYGGTPSDLDSYSQEHFKPSEMDLHDWRRDNVNKMVADVYQVIQDNKPYVTFGLSPFGIWTTDPAVAASEGLTLPEGIVGMDAYKDIYCDPINWLKNGTVDYISPQLYWPTTSTGQDYEVLSPWWSDVCNLFKRHLYVSHSLSSLSASSYVSSLKSGSQQNLAVELNGLSLIEYFSQANISGLKSVTTDPSEYGKQIQVNRDADKNGAPGSVFFRTQQFYTDGFVNYLNTHEFAQNSLAPAINWKTAVDRSVPTNLRIENDTLLWNTTEENVRFVIYAIPNDVAYTPGKMATSEFIIGISYQQFFDLTGYTDLISTHKFAVATLDRYGNEFPAVLMGHTPGQNVAANLTHPTDGQNAIQPFSFSWDEVTGAEFYFLEVATDASFNSMVYKRQINELEFDATNIALEVGSTYYWRVITRMTGVADVASAARSFVLVNPEIVSPANNAVGVSLTPDIVFRDLGEGFSYELQISRDAGFSSFVVDETGIATTTYTVPAETLTTFASYYMRVRTINGSLTSVWSEIVMISTITTSPDIPVILTPTENENVSGPDVTITIAEEPYATSFTMWLSKSDSFIWTDRKVKTLDAYDYSVVYTDLLDNTTYYVKVKANMGSTGSTDWSEIRSFSTLVTGVNDVDTESLILSCPTYLKDNEVKVEYNIPTGGNVKIALYNMIGQEVTVLVNGVLPKGEYTEQLVTSNLKKGMYFLLLQTSSGAKILKLIR
jgi:uncharacterized lipoprotein YddW (UPF0748 family)